MLVDNKDKIDALLKAWNDSVGWIPQGLDAGRTVIAGNSGEAEAGADASADLMAGGGRGACACAAAGRTARDGLWNGVSLAMGMLLARMRRRRAAS